MKILALSKKYFDDFLFYKGINSDNIYQQDKVLFISINNTEFTAGENDTPYLKNAINVKIIYFDDVEKDIDVANLDGSGTTIKAKAFTAEQAKELYSFIKNNIEGKETVLIHCTAGVSRSGAVASFIHDFVGGNWDEFKRNNRYIVPNAHIYRLLHDEWYKDLEFPEGWTEENEKDFKIELLNPKSPEQMVAEQNYRENGNSYTSIEYLTKNEIVERWGKRLSQKELNALNINIDNGK